LEPIAFAFSIPGGADDYESERQLSEGERREACSISSIKQSIADENYLFYESFISTTSHATWPKFEASDLVFGTPDHIALGFNRIEIFDQDQGVHPDHSGPRRARAAWFKS
jgi:hypothetical protein